MIDIFRKFPKIKNFKHVCSDQVNHFSPAVVTYGVKIKLHGTNAGVRISADGQVTAQSRNHDLSCGDDNFGFAAWVDSSRALWADRSKWMTKWPNETIVVFGEWAGTGIQDFDAVTKVTEKSFFVFGVATDSVYITDPSTIEEIIPEIPNVYVLPWLLDPDAGGGTQVDFRDARSMSKFADRINEVVQGIETVDPYIQKTFCISAPGEGVVCVPYIARIAGEVFIGTLPFEKASNFFFKAKVGRYRAQKTKNAASTRVVAPESVATFIDEFVTDARCMQGIYEVCSDSPTKREIPAFLNWVACDVEEEGAHELAEMEVEFKVVKKHVKQAAAKWVRAYLKNKVE